MKLIETLGTLFMIFVVIVLYVLFFHNRHVHPIGKLVEGIKPGVECTKVASAFTEYTEKHDTARFTDINLEGNAEDDGKFQKSKSRKATYKLRLSDKGLFNNPVLTVFCDNNERVVEYSLDIQ